MDTLYQVIVNRFRGKCLIINLCDAEEEMQKMTVLQLKEKMIEQYPEYRRDIETICINCYLIFGDVAMEDSEPLSEYGIQHLSVIDVMWRIRWDHARLGEGSCQAQWGAFPSF
uniref:Ubiquitin-like domain-containing protein n=1 Tax=Oryzias melastigma TaxID=30732 RepID=A0A3B3DJE4_ORYME